MIHVISFSGGKDSTALILHMREKGVEFETVFCDTGWEHPKTYEYIDYINKELLEGKLHFLKSEGMEALVRRKKRVPSARARFCTTELKIKPMKAYLDTLDDDVTVYQGIRAEESHSRSQMPQKTFDDYFDAYIERPLLHWTAEDVFAIHDEYKVQPNPLYTMGAGRVGCFPCVLVNQRELMAMDETMPEVWDRIQTLEEINDRSFFYPKFIPERHQSGFDPKSGKKYPTHQDVRKYIQSKNSQTDILRQPYEVTKCMSIYNLCE